MTDLQRNMKTCNTCKTACKTGVRPLKFIHTLSVAVLHPEEGAVELHGLLSYLSWVNHHRMYQGGGDRQNRLLQVEEKAGGGIQNSDSKSLILSPSHPVWKPVQPVLFVIVNIAPGPDSEFFFF